MAHLEPSAKQTMKNIVPAILVILVLGNVIAPPHAKAAPIKEDLTKQILDILAECEKIVPGTTTRAELLKLFSVEGGLSTRTHRIYVHRYCQNIKVDVDFIASGPTPRSQRSLSERPDDIVSKISKPYLDVIHAD